jgi:Ca2+-binding RTX toxin-like protein
MTDLVNTPVSGASDVVRPAGLGYTPPGAEHYNWRTDIPSDALDAKNFSSIDSWLDACIAQGKPGKIGAGTYEVDGQPRYAPEGIYGYGDTPPKFVAQNVDGWLYLKNQDVALKGVAFEGFGTVLVGAVKLTDGSPYHSTSTYAFERFQPAGEGGHGLAMQVPASVKEVSPDVDISDCTFVNVENAYVYVSDTTQAGRIDFNNNVLKGAYGIMDVNTPLWTEINASGNEWKDATGARVQPNVKSNGMNTGFKIGTDKYIDQDGHYTKLHIENNYAHDIQSVGTYADTNAAVFVDVRGAEALNPADNSVSFNKIVRVQGLKGQEDSNAIYAKAWGLTVQGNYIEASGAAYKDATHNGSETTGVLIKPLQAGIAKDIQVIGNTFVDMPTAPKGVTPDLSVVKISEAIGNTSVSFNTFIGGGNLSGAPASGIVRLYADYENLKVVGNNFKDVALGSTDSAIVFHAIKPHGVGLVEVSNNLATKTVGDYAADIKMISFTAKPTALITGHNELDGGHHMLSSLIGKATATVQTYSPPLVPSGSTPTPTPTPTPNPTPTPDPTPVPPPENGAWLPSAPYTKTITGTDGQDTLTGGSGADLLDGRGREDVMKGGAGDDTYLISGYKDVIVEGANSGVDTAVVSDTRYFLSDNVENLIAKSASATLLVGNTGRNMLTGGAGADTLIGGRGDDYLTGGAGADRFVVAPGDGADVISDFGGSDQVVLGGAQFSSFADVKAAFQSVGGNAVLKFADGGQLVLKGVDPTTLTAAQFSFSGGASAATATGAWTATRSGTTSSEAVYGGDTADYIDGKGGADVLIGGRGDDTYVVDSSNDRVLENVGAGIDKVLLKAGSYAMSANVENLTVGLTTGASVEGNAAANIIAGGDGADTIEGGAGADLLTGGKAADTFVYAHLSDGGDIISDFAPGQDHLDFSDLLAESGGSIVTKAASGGLGVYLNHDGVSDLLVTLKGVTSIFAGDLIV